MTDELKENAALHALGILEEAESSALVAEMEIDPDLVRLVEEYRATLGLVALSVDAIEPSASLRASILSEIAGADVVRETVPEDRIVPFVQKPNRPAVLPWAIAACLALGSIVLVNRVMTLQRDLDLLAAKELDLSAVSLAVLAPATPDQKEGTARVLWNGNTNSGVFESISLPAIPSDRVYQLWVFEKDNPAPIPAGFFNPTDTERPLLRPARPVANIVTVAVSLEVAGGRPQPEGPVVLVGAVVDAG